MTTNPRPAAPFARRRGEPHALGPCRVCGRPSWHGDGMGPVHDCCALVGQDGACKACEESLRLHVKAEKWWQSRKEAA